jgi:hypothetical protein
LPSHHPDGGRGGAGHDPLVALGVLGADGGGHHGRPDPGDGLTLPAGLYAAWFRVKKVKKPIKIGKIGCQRNVGDM